MGGEYPQWEMLANFRGPIADPGPDILNLLDRVAIARIRYKQMEMINVRAQQVVELTRLVMDGLQQEHKLG